VRADQGLAEAANRFIDEVGLVTEVIADRLPDVDGSRVRDDVTLEAFNLAAAFIDADGLETDDELRAFIAAFAPRYGGNLAKATPRDLRASRMITGKSELLARPSALFDILATVDARQGSRHALTYKQRALDIAHTVASLDQHVSRTELLAIETFRSMLAQAMDESARLHRDLDGRDTDGHRGPTGGVPPGADPAGGATTTAAPAATATGDGATGDGADDGTEPLEPARSMDELMAELDGLIGLGPVRDEIKVVANLLAVQRLRQQRGLPTVSTSRHLVFAGNPGTGKTTVARLVAQIYRTLGVVERGHLVETDRAGLVAGYVGQTAARVTEVFDRADGGVLLIDEAYSLARGGDNDFGREAIDTIVNTMEDRRDRVVVIVAGYPGEMDDFLDANPGLRSRFPKTIVFPDYDDDELVRIFEHVAERAHYRTGDGVADAVERWVTAVPRVQGFGNGRLVRNLFEEVMVRHAGRVVAIADPDDDDLVTVTVDDIPPPGVGPAHRREHQAEPG
jgi:hypothetical protein